MTALQPAVAGYRYGRRSSYRLPEKIPPARPAEQPQQSGAPVLDGYVRVSSVGLRTGPRFTSARQQELQIRAYAAARGYTIGEVFVELDRSGRDEQRPQLGRVLARIAAGTSGGVIVTRLDRLSRSVTHALRMLTMLEAHDACLVSIEDGLNSRTPFGRALTTILLALAELEAARIAESTRTSRRRAVERGVHLSANAPTGYRRIPGRGLVPDPRMAPFIVEAFRRRASGSTYADIGRFLSDAGLVTGTGGAWTGKGVHKMLQNPVYVGEAFAAETRNPAAHPQLVRRGLWLGALAASTEARAQAHATTLLAGLARCGGCCHVLGKSYGFRDDWRGPRWPRYRCRRQHRQGACPAPASIRVDALDDTVVAAFLDELDRHRQRPTAVERALAAAEDRLRLAESGVRSHPGWRSACTDVDGRLGEARAEVLARWRQLQLCSLPTARQLRRQWPHLSLPERRRMLATGLECVVVTAGPDPRVHLLFAGARRDWFPSSNRPHPPAPFDPSFATTAAAVGKV